jgi:hypothetical protein
LDVGLPRKVISVECAGHFHVGDDGIDAGIVNARHPIVGCTRFNNVKACMPEGAACKPSDNPIVLNQEYAGRVFLASHVSTTPWPQRSIVEERYMLPVSQKLSSESHFDPYLPLLLPVGK